MIALIVSPPLCPSHHASGAQQADQFDISKETVSAAGGRMSGYGPRRRERLEGRHVRATHGCRCEHTSPTEEEQPGMTRATGIDSVAEGIALMRLTRALEKGAQLTSKDPLYSESAGDDILLCNLIRMA